MERKLKTIEKELGEEGSESKEVKELLDKIKKAKMPEEVEKKAKKELKKIIDVQIQAVKKIGKQKDIFEPAVESDIENEIKEWLGDKLEKAINEAPAREKNLAVAESLKDDLIKYL